MTPFRPLLQPSLLEGDFCRSPSHNDLIKEVIKISSPHSSNSVCVQDVWRKEFYVKVSLILNNKKFICSEWFWRRKEFMKHRYFFIISILPRCRSKPLVIVVLRDLLDPSIHLLPLDLLLALSEGCTALNHLVDEAAEAEPVWAEGVFLVVDNLGSHVAHRAHAAPHRVALGYLHGQTQIRYPKISNCYKCWAIFLKVVVMTRRPQFY